MNWNLTWWTWKKMQHDKKSNAFFKLTEHQEECEEQCDYCLRWRPSDRLDTLHLARGNRFVKRCRECRTLMVHKDGKPIIYP